MSTTDLIVGVPLAVGAVTYVTSLIRDWRPMRALRQENRDLRDDLNRANEKIRSLEEKLAKLEKATDLSVLQSDHQEIAKALERVASTLDRLDGSVKANTAAVEVLAKQQVIVDAVQAG